MTTGNLTIGKLASRCGVSRDTLRFYERERLLPKPKRSASGYRLYEDGDAARVRFVKRAQAIGLTLEDIRQLLNMRRARTADECRRVADRLRARIRVVDEKIARLRAFRIELVRNLEKCERADSGSCPVVLDLAVNGAADAREPAWVRSSQGDTRQDHRIDFQDRDSRRPSRTRARR